MTISKEALKPQPRMPSDHFGEMSDGCLAHATAGFERQWLCPQRELEHYADVTFFQLRQKSLVDVTGINIALGRTSRAAARQSGFHFRGSHQPVIDVRGESRGRREDLVVRKGADVVIQGSMHVRQRSNNALGRVSFAWPYRRGPS